MNLVDHSHRVRLVFQELRALQSKIFFVPYSWDRMLKADINSLHRIFNKRRLPYRWMKVVTYSKTLYQNDLSAPEGPNTGERNQLMGSITFLCSG